MPAKPRGWSAKLTRPIALPDGVELHTLADARDMILRVPEERQRWSAWQSAAGKLMAAAESGAAGDVEAATTQLKLAS